MHAVISRFGFQPRQFYYTLRTAIGACCALFLAWALGLEHPQWAAMSVWIASQPTRGMLLEKGLFRMLGTALGCLFGIGLVLASHNQPWMLVIGLALWVSTCAGIGNILRGYASYGAILAGYSAALVALINTAHPEQIMAVGVDRFATVLVGISVALLIGCIFNPVRQADVLRDRVHMLTVRLLRDLAASLNGTLHAPTAEHRALLSEIALIEEGLDPHASGSLRSRNVARTLRQLLVAQVSVVLWMGSGCSAVYPRAVANALIDSATGLARSAGDAAVLDPLRHALSLVPEDAPLADVLQRLQAALQQALALEPEQEPLLRAFESHPMHRDWVGMGQVALRVLVVMLLVGGFWVITGWKPGAYILLGSSVMLSLFSTFDNPALMMRPVIIGSALGLTAALFCRWLLWPAAGSQLELLYLLIPLILIGAPILAHPRTAPIGLDYNLILLIMLQPSYPLKGEFSTSLMSGIAMLAAPCLAMLAYRWIFRQGLAQRAQMIKRMMLSELEGMAADPKVISHRSIWQARLYHRLIRLVRLSDKAGGSDATTLDYCLTILQMGTLVIHLHTHADALTTQAASRRVMQSTLLRLSRLRSNPQQALNALRRMSHSRHARHLPRPELLKRGMQGLQLCMAQGD